MNMEITAETRLVDLTVGQLLDYLSRHIKAPEKRAQKAPKRYAYGIAGIAQIFNCSLTTANRIKKSGVIDDAIHQSGRIIVTDIELALQLFNNK